MFEVILGIVIGAGAAWYYYTQYLPNQENKTTDEE